MKRSLLAIAAAVSVTALSAIAQPGPQGQGPGAGPMRGPTQGQMPMQGGMRGPMNSAAFAEIDTNKDGKLSKDEIAAYFDRLDTNKDGFLSQEELAAARAQHMHQHSRADASGDGMISRDEAKALPRLSSNFDAIDTNKDGMLSRDEMRAFYQARGAEGFAALDKNGDGYLTANEVIVSPDVVYRGYSLPRDLVSFQNGFDFFNRHLRLTALLDYKGGGNPLARRGFDIHALGGDRDRSHHDIPLGQPTSMRSLALSVTSRKRLTDR